MMLQVEWLQLMSQVQDRVRGRAPLILVLSGALLLVIGGWPGRCTAMPKDLLLANGSSGRTDYVKCEISDLTRDTSEQQESVGGSGPQTPVPKGDVMGSAENSNVRILLRTNRSIPSINSNTSSPATVRLRHRVNSASVIRNSRASSRNRTKSGSNLERNERSANLSHITSKIQLFIKNRLLQILPDGTVNGTQDDSSDYTILQRTAVDIGKIKIQSVATCMFLCMDACGNPFASKDFTEECIFNEAMELHHYNTYSSAKHSNSRRILYLALNRHGQTRKIHIPITRSLGKLSTYTNALTHPVDEAVTQSLLAKLFGSNHVRHGLKQLCESEKVHLHTLTATTLVARPKCLMNEKAKKTLVSSQPTALLSAPVAKRGKKKGANAKKCTSDGNEDQDGEIKNAGDCIRPTPIQMLVTRKRGPQKPNSVVKCAASDDNCSPKKVSKRRPTAGAPRHGGGGAAGKLNSNGKRKKAILGLRTTTTPSTTTAEEEDMDNTDEEGGVGGLPGVGTMSAESDDLAQADDSSIIQTHHHLLNFNRLSSSLADEDEADFD